MNETHPDQYYHELAEKWLNGTITPEEARVYADWYNDLAPDQPLMIPSHIAADKETHRKKILHNINKARHRKPRTLLRMMAAAVILIALSLVLYNYLKPAAAVTTVAKTIPNDIQPGHNGAILTLANGQTIVLDTAGNGQLAHHVVKSDGGLVVTAMPGAMQYNTLVTPRARQQQLTLSDGTKVWLNAESSIKFPTAFDSKRREVAISGEVYFEVAKQKVPFVVSVSDTKVEVLGTHFNINAYANEDALRTTLLEGKVKIGSAVLKPGQQAVYNQTMTIENDVDLDLVVAWKNGMQSFASADIKTVMRQIERWYDVEVEYKGNIPVRTFTGDIPRNANLSELLTLFEAAKINFTIDTKKKKLTVLP